MTQLPPQVDAVAKRFAKMGFETWLFGSQVNATAKPSSDWDLLVFGTEELLSVLANEIPVDDVDLLIVYDGDRFASPWNRTDNGSLKSGSLTEWKWKLINDEEAVYEGTKWPDDWGSPKKAIMLRR
jgi:predicted nucleotidyltransferase